MDLVNEYLEEHAALHEVSPRFLLNKASTIRRGLRVMAELGAAPETATTAQVIATLGAIKRIKARPNYVRGVFIHTRAFLVWMAGKNPALEAEKYRDAEIPRPQLKTKKATDLLTLKDMETLINACRTSRDRAIISMMYDGSNRPIELLTLTWGDLHWDDYGVWFTTSAKTGKGRRIRLTAYSIPYLSQWRSEYPGTPEGEARVFVSNYLRDGKPIGISLKYLDALIKDLRDRTGIKKVKASIFRPSKITEDVRAGLDPAYIALKNWGSLKTSMLDVYATPGGEYIDRVALEASGEAPPAMRRPMVTTPPTCPGCGEISPPTARYCMTCGRPMTGEATTSQAGLIRLIDARIKAQEKKK